MLRMFLIIEAINFVLEISAHILQKKINIINRNTQNRQTKTTPHIKYLLPLNAIFINFSDNSVARFEPCKAYVRTWSSHSRPQIETDLEYVPNSAKTICGIRLWISLNIFRRRRSGDTGKCTQDGDDGGDDDDGSETGEIMFSLFLSAVEHARTRAKNRPLSV